MNLKTNLLYTIIENNNAKNRYSKAYTSLRSVFNIEVKDNFKFTKDMYSTMKQISKEYNKFINDIPLMIIEKYYDNKMNNLNSYVFIEYQGKEVNNLKVIDIFHKLEDFYSLMYELACTIANYYNLEIKLNESKNSNNFV